MEYKEAKAILNQFGFSWIKINADAHYFQPFDEMYDTCVTALEIAQAGDPEALKQTCRAKLQKLIDQLQVLQGAK